MAKKHITLGDAETMRQKAVEFLNRIGKEDEAAKFEDMDTEAYVEHKGLELIENPSQTNRRTNNMATRGKSKAQLEAELDESNDYIEQLEGRLDDIAGLAGDSEDEDENDEDSDEETDDNEDR